MRVKISYGLDIKDVPLKVAEVDIDQAITESQHILVGLNNYYNGEENVSDGRSTMDTSRNADEQTTDTGEG